MVNRIKISALSLTLVGGLLLAGCSSSEDSESPGKNLGSPSASATTAPEAEVSQEPTEEVVEEVPAEGFNLREETNDDLGRSMNTIVEAAEWPEGSLALTQESDGDVIGTRSLVLNEEGKMELDGRALPNAEEFRDDDVRTYSDRQFGALFEQLFLNSSTPEDLRATLTTYLVPLVSADGTITSEALQEAGRKYHEEKLGANLSPEGVATSQQKIKETVEFVVGSKGTADVETTMDENGLASLKLTGENLNVSVSW